MSQSCSSSQSVPDTILDDPTEDEPDEDELLKMLEEFDSQDTDMEEEREERIKQQKQAQEELHNLAVQQGHGNTLSWDGEVEKREEAGDLDVRARQHGN